MALKTKNCVSSSINVIPQKPKKCMKNLTECEKINLIDTNLHKYFIFDGNKKKDIF